MDSIRNSCDVLLSHPVYDDDDDDDDDDNEDDIFRDLYIICQYDVESWCAPVFGRRSRAFTEGLLEAYMCLHIVEINFKSPSLLSAEFNTIFGT